jgi:hypothetical protein
LFILHFVFVWYSLILVEQLLHLVLRIWHEFNFESTLLHAHAHFVVNFDGLHQWIQFVQQSTYHTRHNHEFVILQVDMSFAAICFVHDLQSAHFIPFKCLHALGLVAFWKQNSKNRTVVWQWFLKSIFKFIYNIWFTYMKVWLFNLIYIFGGVLLVK